MQMLPLIALLLARRSAGRCRDTAGSAGLVAGVSYFMLFALLLAQALRGKRWRRLRGVSIAAFIVWASARRPRLDRPRRPRRCGNAVVLG
jgi:hypothetical protein